MFDLGIPEKNIIDIEDSPYRLIERENLELLAIPYQKDYSRYTQWVLPEKKKSRIALAHAVNNDLVFKGIDEEEEKVSVMDSDLFARFGVDYAALGHIHKTNAKQIGNTILVYPGSSRVWRKDEEGERYVYLLECTTVIKSESVVLKSAGQFRKYRVNVSLDGQPEMDLASQMKAWEPNDWIWIDFVGLVEDSATFKESLQKIKTSVNNNVRKIDLNDSEVRACANISSQEIAKKFLEIWEKKKPADVGDELEAWEKARSVGLSKIEQSMHN
jgi:DNA repair exonuclease SbcCD nuclease subunit